MATTKSRAPMSIDDLTEPARRRLGISRPGDKFDDKKPRWELLPLVALEQVVGVLTFGARKYVVGGWREVPKWRSRYLGALWRHVVAYMRGERIDPESGQHHLAHAVCCALFIIELDIGGGREVVDQVEP